jgi:hypothetical protein
VKSSKFWAVAYFYFDFSNILKQEYGKMLRSLIKQLSEQLRYTSDSLERLFTACTSGSGQPPTDEALLNTLGQLVKDFDQVYIILDALDECAERLPLLDGLMEMHNWNHPALHILVTSREEKDIEDELIDLLEKEQKVLIHKSFIEADIRAYIASRLQTDRNLRRWRKDDEVQLTIANRLIEKADGM